MVGEIQHTPIKRVPKNRSCTPPICNLFSDVKEIVTGMNKRLAGLKMVTKRLFSLQLCLIIPPYTVHMHAQLARVF